MVVMRTAMFGMEGSDPTPQSKKLLIDRLTQLQRVRVVKGKIPLTWYTPLRNGLIQPWFMSFATVQNDTGLPESRRYVRVGIQGYSGRTVSPRIGPRTPRDLHIARRKVVCGP